jgi:prepilin-type N-terminal cleavage/methylation domain-containing protein
MEFSNTHSGFSFIEVVIALAVIGILLTSIFAVQQAMMQASFSSTNTLRRVLLLKNVLYDPTIVREKHDEERKTEQRIKEPPARVRLVIDKPVQKRLKALELERIRAQVQWEDFIGRQEELLLLFKMVLPKKEERA